MNNGEAIARKLGLKYEGIQQGIGMQFTDPETGSTFYGNTLDEVKIGLQRLRQRYAEHKENRVDPLTPFKKDISRIKELLPHMVPEQQRRLNRIIYGQKK